MNDSYALVRLYRKSLEGLKNILAKAEAAGLDEATLLADRLAPDMFPLAKQVQITCDNAKLALGRLAGVEAPKFEDAETTIAELTERIDKTIAFLDTLSPEQFAGAAERRITLPYFPGKYLSGTDYAHEYALPNFFFHYTTAYDLIRKNGVAIGKADFMNGLPLKNE